MRFYLFSRILKLELAKYSLGFILLAYLFAVVFYTRLNRKMTSQSTLATFQRNKNSNSRDAFAQYILSSNNKETLINHGNETEDNSIVAYETKSNLCLDASLLSGFEKYASVFKIPKLAIVFSPYLNERYLGKPCRKSSIPGNYGAIEDNAGKKVFPNEKNMYLKSQVNPKFHSKESIFPADPFSQDKYIKNNAWAAWKKSESSVSCLSNHDKPVRFTDLLISLEKYYEKDVSVSMKTVRNDYGFKSGNKIRIATNRNVVLKENKTSTFKPSLVPISNYDSAGFKKKRVSHSFNSAVTEQHLRKTDSEYKFLINAKLLLEGVIAKMILSNVPNDFDFMKDCKILLLICLHKLSEMENKSKILANEEFSTEKNLSKLVLSIMQDDSNSDLKNLEDRVNCYYSNASTYVNYEDSNYRSTYWKYNEAQSSDESLAQIPPKESSGTDKEYSEASSNDESLAQSQQNESSGTDREYCEASCNDESLAQSQQSESSGIDRECSEASSNDESLARIPQDKSSGLDSACNESHIIDESSAQISLKESLDADYQFTNDKDEKLKILEGSYPMTKRVRGSSIDSGIYLDSNFEEVSPEASAQESDLSSDENSSACKKDASCELTSDLKSEDSSDVDDCHKVCQICEKVVLNKFFLSNRFGLLLNCFHSYCYQCVRNRTKSKRLSTDLVACPKCGQNSPGIVSSPRWIRDSNEKTILFQEYEKESKFFNEQQQVFLKFVF